jgi:hypothetical protein
MPDPIDYRQMLADALRNPEAFKAQFGNANRSFDTEDTLLQQQLAQAQALAGQGNPWAVGPNATAGSALLGGLADVLRGVSGAKMQTDAQTKLQQLTPQKEAAKLDKQRLDFAMGRVKAEDEKDLANVQHPQRLLGGQLLVGADGKYYRLDPVTGMATPVQTPEGVDVSKPQQQPKPENPEKNRHLKLTNDRLESQLKNAANKEGAGKQLPTSALDELAGIDTALGQLSDLESVFKSTGQAGLGGKVGGIATEKLGLQGTEAAKYEAAAAAVRQGVGKILEGGKLAAGDEAKYKNMLPKPGDSLDVLTQKAASLKSFLSKLKSDRISTYEQGGYAAPKPKAMAKAVDHYLISPDGKVRVAVYSDGSEGAEEPVP